MSCKELRKRQRQREIEAKELLVGLVHERPAIWDKRLREHRDRDLLDIQWGEIEEVTGRQRVELKKTWKNLVDHFRTQYAEVCWKLKKSGNDTAPITDLSKWHFFKHLLFLQEVMPKLDVSLSDVSYESDSMGHGDGSQIMTEAIVGEVQMQMSSTKHEVVVDRWEDSVDLPMSSAHTPTMSERPSTPSSPEASTSRMSAKHGHMACSVPSSHTSKTVADEAVLETFGTVNNPPEDSAEKFGTYIADVLRGVPMAKRRKCEFEIMRIALEYQECNE